MPSCFANVSYKHMEGQLVSGSLVRLYTREQWHVHDCALSHFRKVKDIGCLRENKKHFNLLDGTPVASIQNNLTRNNESCCFEYFMLFYPAFDI